MKINKKFVRKILDKKTGKIQDVIKEMKILKFSENNKNRITNFFTVFEEMEKIQYTLEFLKRNGLIIPNNSNLRDAQYLDFDPTDLDHDKNITERINFLFEDFLKKVWEEEFKINFTLYNFVDRYYMTKTEYRDMINFWVPVSLGLLSAVIATLGIFF